MKKSWVFLLAFSLFFSVAPNSAQANNLSIWEKLEGSSPNGYVLLLRHSIAPGSGDPENFKLGDCSTQRNLSQQGREQAKRIGEWIKQTEIEIFRIESSRWCRARDTAELMGLGKVRLNRSLDSLFGKSNIARHPNTLKIKEQIINHRKKPGLLILVGHFVNIAAITGVGVNSGTGVLVRANSRGKIRVVGSTPNFDQ